MATRERHLAAILFTDIVGYTAMMQNDEHRAVQVIKHYHEALDKSVKVHRGEVLNNYGDGSLCSFTSSLEALKCAIALQGSLQSEPTVPLRIGLHVGEIFFENGKVLGDGVNVASRIQSLGIANSILLSSEIYSKIKNKPEFKTVSLGSFQFKNVNEEVEVFALANDGLTMPDKNKIEGKLKSKRNFETKAAMVAAALVLVAAVGYFFYLKFGSDTITEQIDKSIAVLPFVDMSPGKDMEYFGDGMADEIINVLAQTNDLKVIARTSSFQFKGKNEDVRRIGEMLGVATILEGSVKKSNNLLRVTAQLIKVSDGTHLWSRTFDIGMDDIFGVQDEIASTVVKALKIELSGSLMSTAVASRNEEAYKLYQQGRYFYDRWGIEDIPKALELFNASLAMDSTQPMVWAYLASTQYHSGREPQEAIDKSLGLDPYLAEANIIQALSYSRACNFRHSRQSVENALNHGGRNSPMVLRLAGKLLSGWGNHQLALQLLERSVTIDPLIANGYMQLGFGYLNNKEYEKAISTLKRALYISNDNRDAPVALAEAFLLQGKPDSAVRVAESMNRPAFRLGFNALAAFAKGNHKKSDSLLRQFEATYKGNPMLANIYAYTDRKMEAMALIRDRVREFPCPVGLLNNPFLDNLREEDEFKQIISSLDIPKF